MFKFLLYRVLQSVAVIYIILTVTFFMVRLIPGGPFSAERKMPAYILEKVNAYYGLDKPVLVQYGNYLGGLFRGDLGPTFTETRTVNEILADTFPVSLELGGRSTRYVPCHGEAFVPSSMM